jgi:hypothetical protein
MDFLRFGFPSSDFVFPQFWFPRRVSHSISFSDFRYAKCKPRRKDLIFPVDFLLWSPREIFLFFVSQSAPVIFCHPALIPLFGFTAALEIFVCVARSQLSPLTASAWLFLSAHEAPDPNLRPQSYAVRFRRSACSISGAWSVLFPLLVLPKSGFTFALPRFIPHFMLSCGACDQRVSIRSL